MSSSASAGPSPRDGVIEVLQWEPRSERLKQVASAAPSQIAESSVNLARRFAFRRDCGLWMAFRSVQVQTEAPSSSACLEVKDLECIAAPEPSDDGGYYWNSGPGAVGTMAGACPSAASDTLTRSVSFTIPVSQEQRAHAHHRWRVPLSDIRSVERHLFSQPIDLVFKRNGELAPNAQGDGSTAGPSAGGRGRGKEKAAAWAFRVWGPCGLIVSLAGEVDLFLVCASAQSASALEAALLRGRRSAYSSPSMRPSVPKNGSMASPMGSPKLGARQLSVPLTVESPLLFSGDGRYNPSFASFARPSAVTLNGTVASHTQSDVGAANAASSPPRLEHLAASSGSATGPDTSLPTFYQNNLPPDGRPSFLAGVSTSSPPEASSSPLPSAPCSAPRITGASSQLLSVSSSGPLPCWQPLGYPPSSLVPGAQVALPLTTPTTMTAPTALTGTVPSKRTLHVRPFVGAARGGAATFGKVHMVPGGETRKPHAQRPFPEQLVYLSKHRTCFLHRAEHRLRGHRTRPCVAIDLLQTTIVNTEPTTHVFVLEYACLSVRPDDWSRLAAIREVPHPLSQPGQPRVAYILALEVLAPSLPAKAEWIDWMHQRGAVLAPDYPSHSGSAVDDAPPLAITATAPEAEVTPPPPPPPRPPRAADRPVPTPAPKVPNDRSAARRVASAPLPTPFSPMERDDTDAYAAAASSPDSSSLRHSLLAEKHLAALPEVCHTWVAPEDSTVSTAAATTPASESAGKLVVTHTPPRTTAPLATSEPPTAPSPSTPQMFGRVTPLWVSASYSPDKPKPHADVVPPRRRPFHSPLSIMTSANDTPHVLREGRYSDEIGGGPSPLAHTVPPMPAAIAARLSLLADTSPTQTVDVDTTGDVTADASGLDSEARNPRLNPENDEKADEEAEEDAVYDAPVHLVAITQTAHHTSPLDDDGDDDGEGFTVEKPDSATRHGAPGRPVHVLAPSTSLRCAAPVLPLQEAAPAPAARAPPAIRVLPPPTPPADLAGDDDSDFDAIAHRLAQFNNAGRAPVAAPGTVASPFRLPRGPPGVDRAERSPLIYDSSVLLTSSASPASPSASPPPRASRADADESHADHFDSPVDTSTRRPHWRTPDNTTTQSSVSPYSAVQPPSSGSPLPAMRGQILFHPLDGTTPRASSTARTLTSVSPPTSRNSTADVVTAVSTPLRVRPDTDTDDDEALLYCSPDVMAAKTSAGASERRPPPSPRGPAPPVVRPVRMAPLPTPTERVPTDEDDQTHPAFPLPAAIQPFFEDGYGTSFSRYPNKSAPFTTHFQDPRGGGSNERTLSTARNAEALTWTSVEDRKEAFRQSLHALREARANGQF